MDNNDYEELLIEEVIQKPISKTYHSAKIAKKSTETISTQNCTLELDKPFLFSTPRCKESNCLSHSSSSKSFSKCFSELPNRLTWLKQLSENKIKFLRVEKEIKELEDCTFKPKTNNKVVRSSLLNFYKKQKDYMKTKNTKIAMLKKQYLIRTEEAGGLKSAHEKSKTDGKVHERLYSESRVFNKTTFFRRNY